MSQIQCPKCKHYDVRPMKTAKVLKLTAYSGVFFWIGVFIEPTLAMLVLIGGSILTFAALIAPDKRYKCMACKFELVPEAQPKIGYDAKRNFHKV